MAYDFLGLVNDVNRRLNEVELTSSNFNSARGFYSHAKDAVNSAIQDINQTHTEWPFNYSSEDEVLVVGQTRYDFPADTKLVDMETFRIRFNETLGVRTEKLQIISYEEYLDRFVDQEYNTDTSLRSVPRFVFRAPNLQYGISPAPDQAYTLTFEYFINSPALSNFNDVPIIPEVYRHIVIDGSMYYAYLFRGNTQDALVAKDKFTQGLKNMRIILVNRYEYVRSTAITRNRLSSYVYRLA